MKRFARLALCGLLAAVGVAPAQIPPPPEGIEVLARGPVHEAFAATAEVSVAGPIVPRMPPDPVEELPPDQRPEGDNVQWLPGYWQYDEERADFIWVSGFWRDAPPGRAWFPGSWRELPGGRQWVSGFWQEVTPQAAARQLEYLPPPPMPLELAPSVPAPTVTSFYVPGCWTWRDRYVWRPGYWIEHRPDWVWVPAHYRCTPAGYLFVDGYWDYPLERRGVLFAPVSFGPAVLARPAFVYTPTYAVSHDCMVSALFVRSGFGSYYFGDYFEARYVTAGFNPWCGAPRGSSFAVSINFGRTPVYDPLWNHYQAQHRQDARQLTHLQDVYAGRYTGSVPRPPRTLVQQTTIINNVTNVTVNNSGGRPDRGPRANVADLAMVQPLATMPRGASAMVLKPVAREDRDREQRHAHELRQVGVERGRAETKIADRQFTPEKPTDRPRRADVRVPDAVVARAQAPAPTRNPVPPRPSAKQAEMNARVPAVIPPARDLRPQPTPTPVAPPPTERPMPGRPVPPATSVVKPTPPPVVVPPAPVVKPAPVAPPVVKPTPMPTPVVPQARAAEPVKKPASRPARAAEPVGKPVVPPAPVVVPKPTGKTPPPPVVLPKGPPSAVPPPKPPRLGVPATQPLPPAQPITQPLRGRTEKSAGDPQRRGDTKPPEPKKHDR